MSSSFSRDVGSKTLTFEAGKLAQYANGAVTVSYGDSVVLATATMSDPREGIDFFPLSIEFEERHYARGKIPGSFFRREGRPSTEATLIARMTDRPIRPLFPKGFHNEIQVIIITLSSDQENPLDVLAIIGASTALSISDIPFEGPIGATQMGYVDGRLVVNPTYEQLEMSELDLVAVGSKDGVIMIESGANELPEDLVLEAIQRAQEVNQEVIELQEEIVRSIGKAKVSVEVESHPEELDQRAATILGGRIASVLGSSTDKASRAEQLDALKTQLVQDLGDEFQTTDIKRTFDGLLEKEFRSQVLAGGSRPDGRGAQEMRPISCEVAVLPRTHGTGLFARGETQALAVATLGSVGDAQKLDTLSPEVSKRFMLHYNFLPFSTGEVRRVGSPRRREIGHGALAERALSAVIPPEDEFPYTIRLVSEILSSNGSTSMASICASTLALMDAGVPIKTPIAGISIGLIKGEDDRHVILTDIQGLEDHIGDMDFKVAGSDKGITAMQLDIKVKSIGLDIIREALEQAREARLTLLERISETISEARPELSPYAPRMVRITIPVEKIGAVIGPGGKVIRGIIEATKATVDVQDDGSVFIGSTDGQASDDAIKMIRDLTREIQVGEIFTGKIVNITSFGAFVELLPGRDGLVHISELADHHIPSVEDAVSMGEEITVIVTEIDAMGRVKLSRRALIEGSADSPDGAGGSRPVVAREQPGGSTGSQVGGEGRLPYQQRERRGGDRGGYRPQGPRQGGNRGGSRPFNRRPPPR